MVAEKISFHLDSGTGPISLRYDGKDEEAQRPLPFQLPLF